MNFKNVDWETVFQPIGHPSLILDRQHNILATNPAIMKLLGKSQEYIKGRKCFELFHGTKKPPERCPLETVLTSDRFEVREMEMETMKSNFLVSCTPVHNGRGQIERIIHIATDISDYRQSLKSLEESEEKYRSLVESTDDSIYLVDRNYRYQFINKKHLSRIGLSKDQFVRSLAFHEFHTSEETATFIDNVDTVFKTGVSHQYEYLSLRDCRYFLQTFSPVKERNGETVAITVTSKDITKMKQLEETLRSLSFTDELTGLYNKSGFTTLTQQQLKVANRLQRGVFLLYADIDNLKQINDKYGHPEGDQLLKKTANLLKDIFRGSDTIARIGGDEFVVFSIETTDTNYDIIKTRFQQKLDNYNTKSDRPYTLTINTGIAYQEEGYSFSIDELMEKADKAMYEQKKNKPS
ncbi:MAG: sensor domain-containing diguanylate cyclase [Promethearchaeota archaeon]|jgi:diguanylate cyclase (GGDEF)-like protein/PAS domain S-box-containing protein